MSSTNTHTHILYIYIIIIIIIIIYNNINRHIQAVDAVRPYQQGTASKLIRKSIVTFMACGASFGLLRLDVLENL